MTKVSLFGGSAGGRGACVESRTWLNSHPHRPPGGPQLRLNYVGFFSVVETLRVYVVVRLSCSVCKPHS